MTVYTEEKTDNRADNPNRAFEEFRKAVNIERELEWRKRQKKKKSK